MRCARIQRSSTSGPPWRCSGPPRTCGGSPVTRGGVMPDATDARVVCAARWPKARAITLVESDDPAGWQLVREVYPKTGQAAVIGLTGAPGAGKSTLIGALIK